MSWRTTYIVSVVSSGHARLPAIGGQNGGFLDDGAPAHGTPASSSSHATRYEPSREPVSGAVVTQKTGNGMR